MRIDIQAPRVLLACLLLPIVLLAAACGAGAQASEQVPISPAGEDPSTVGAAETTTTTVPLPFDALSTFESKDPFVAKIVASTSSPAAAPASTGITASGGATTSTTVAGSAGTTSTTAPGAGTTTTSAPSQVQTKLHSLKVLSIETVNEQPVVTFEVDDVVYQDRQEGEVLSTSWGQVKVVEIDAEAQEVVFLHGSETRVLKVGQEFLK